MLTDHICASCGRVFYAKNPNANTCSNTCRVRFSRDQRKAAVVAALGSGDATALVRAIGALGIS